MYHIIPVKGVLALGKVWTIIKWKGIFAGHPLALPSLSLASLALACLSLFKLLLSLAPLSIKLIKTVEIT